MKNTKKLLALLLAAAMVFVLAACGKPETVSEETSESVGRYISGASVVDRYNRVDSNYTVDKNGNIVNDKNQLLVSAEKTAEYVPVTGLTLTGGESISFPVQLPTGAGGAVQPVDIELKVTIAPATATCKEINVSSSDTDVAEPQNSVYTMGLDSDSVSVAVTLKTAGTAKLTFSSPTIEGARYDVTMDVSAVVSGTALPLSSGSPANPGASVAPGTSAAPGASANPTASTNPSPSGTGRTGYVIVDGANFRKGAGTNSDVIDVLGWGKQITIYGISNGWAQVTADGQSGYIASNLVSYTKPTAAPTASPTPTASDPYASGNSAPSGGSAGYVTGEGVNLRAGASTNSEVLGSFAKGTRITIHSISNGWAYVTVDGITGYMSANYVSYDAPSGGGTTATTAPTQQPEETDDPYAGGIVIG